MPYKLLFVAASHITLSGSEVPLATHLLLKLSKTYSCQLRVTCRSNFLHSNSCPAFSRSNFIEKSPILDLKTLPNLRSILHTLLNQLSLLTNLHIDFLSRVLSLDMRHVNRDQDISTLLLQADQGQDYRREIRVLGVWS